MKAVWLLKSLRLLLAVALVLVGLWLFDVNEAAYLAWTQGGPEIPDQIPRDIGAFGCFAAAAALVWAWRRWP